MFPSPDLPPNLVFTCYQGFIWFLHWYTSHCFRVTSTTYSGRMNMIEGRLGLGSASQLLHRRLISQLRFFFFLCSSQALNIFTVCHWMASTIFISLFKIRTENQERALFQRWGFIGISFCFLETTSPGGGHNM